MSVPPRDAHAQLPAYDVRAPCILATDASLCPTARFSDIFLFFFQAEDGIRDLTVTGVQTCALPISSGSGRRARAPGGGRGAGSARMPRQGRAVTRAPASRREALSARR